VEVTLTVDDGNGNSTECSFTVTLEDDTDPQITCPHPDGDILYADENCEAELPDYTSLATISDNCTPIQLLQVSQSPAPGTILSGDNDSVEVTITVDDGNGNTNECSFTVTLLDDTDPTIVCPHPDGDILYLDAENCQAILPDYRQEAIVDDNCADPVSLIVAQFPPPGTLFEANTTLIVTLSVSDGNGNDAECYFEVDVVDDVDPTIICPYPDGTALWVDENCEVVVPDYRDLAIVDDNCTEPEFLIVNQFPSPGTILEGPNESFIVILEVSDGSGNEAQCSFVLSIIDDIDPEITCPYPEGDTIYLNENCEAIVPNYTHLATISDNCTDDEFLIVTQTPSPGTIFTEPNVTHTITLVVDDGNGNTAECTFEMTVFDSTEPLIICPDDPALLMLSVDENCEILLPDFRDDATIAGNCTDPVDFIITQSPEPGTLYSGPGTTVEVTLTIEDPVSGYTNSCTFEVTLVDDTDPSITCPYPEGDILFLNENCEVLLPDYTVEALVEDNCTDPGQLIITQVPEPGIVLTGHNTVHVVILTVDDGNGNFAECSFEVMVIDDTDPSIVCPYPDGDILNLDENCEVLLPDYTLEAIFSDNCTDPEQLTVVQSPAPGTLYSEAITFEVILVVSDGNGNTAQCSVDVTIVDNGVPYIICPFSNGDILYLDDNCQAVLPNYITPATYGDNCTDPEALSVVQSPPASSV